MILYRIWFWVCLFQEIGNVNLFIYLFKQRLVDCYTQKWRNDINASNRCLHYKNFKSLLNVEKYLLLDIPFVYKRSFSKFRCSNHKLTIETGRHINIPREQRICNYCLNNRNVSVIDCEFHAFFHCHKYNEVREQYLLSWYSGRMELSNFYVLMNSNCERTIRNVCIYIHHIICINSTTNENIRGT